MRKQTKQILDSILWVLGIIALVLLMWGIISPFVSAAEQSYCCEKTKTGAWCINSAKENCDSSGGLRTAPTSCESTSYCKLGTCYDKLEGTCMKNTPQRVCQESGGIWDVESAEDLAQCQLGCCLVGDQAAFVTQVRCNRLSSIYGLEINFRKDISNELDCIASATSEVKGACVFEENFQNKCKFTTKRECSAMKSGNSTGGFHEGYLCSDPDLETVCGPSDNTICVEGKDEVYFIDTCGNLANIYDTNWKTTKPDYWSKVYDKTGSCGYGEGNSNSKVCGNCDYYRGSTCKKTSGNNICKDLGCPASKLTGGVVKQHGETWCAEANGVSKITSFEETATNAAKENLPGSRYFRMVCYDNEVTIEPCADYRQEVCTQSELNGFATAVCRVNRWQDCYSQENQQDCENEFRRDCQWIKGVKLNQPNAGASGKTDASASPMAFTQKTTPSTITGAVVSEEEVMLSPSKGSCVPMYSPGFNFWDENSEADSVCSQASVQCIVTWEEGLTGKPTCVDGCECIATGWEAQMNQACIALGDCGAKTNYIGVKGYHDSKAFYSKKEVEEK